MKSRMETPPEKYVSPAEERFTEKLEEWNGYIDIAEISKEQKAFFVKALKECILPGFQWQPLSYRDQFIGTLRSYLDGLNPDILRQDVQEYKHKKLNYAMEPITLNEEEKALLDLFQTLEAEVKGYHDY
jgi:hypothetical protein